MSAPEWIDDLEAALVFPNTALIIRGPSLIAELRGPLVLRRGSDWLTIGEHAGTHVHLRSADVGRCRLVRASAANIQLELQDAAGTTLCKVSFRNTNPAPAKQDRFDAELTARVQARFGHLSD